MTRDGMCIQAEGVDDEALWDRLCFIAAIRNTWLQTLTELKPDPRDPDHSRSGMFVHHNCSKCDNGAKPCIARNPSNCSWPIARND